jgi:hypothetical protein
MPGFQFTPVGILPLGLPGPNLGEEVAGGAVVAQPAQSLQPEFVPPVPLRALPAASPKLAPAPTASSSSGATEPLTGKEIARLARARIRALDKILRSVPALEEERASLKRLLAAAAPAPRPRKPTGKLQ